MSAPSSRTPAVAVDLGSGLARLWTLGDGSRVAPSVGEAPSRVTRLVRATVTGHTTGHYNQEGSDDMTRTLHDPAELFRDALEDQYRRHSEQLEELTVYRRLPDRGGYDDATLAALTTSVREALAETAHALRRVADGTYGTCERCGQPIPLERLEILPHARYCVPCQRKAG